MKTNPKGTGGTKKRKVGPGGSKDRGFIGNDVRFGPL